MGLMRNFVRVVSIASAVVAAFAFWSGVPVRASLLLVLALALWIAQTRAPKPPPLLVAATAAAVVVLVAMFVGPYSLVLFDVVRAAP